VPGIVAEVEFVSVPCGESEAEAEEVVEEVPLRVEVQADGRFACSYCQHSFKTKQSCTRHFAIHLGITRCSICYKLFSRLENLKLHQSSVHKAIFCPTTDNLQ